MRKISRQHISISLRRQLHQLFSPHREDTVMKNFGTKIKRFLVSEDGPTAVEYAVMLSLIVIVCITAITAVGTNAEARFNEVKDALT